MGAKESIVTIKEELRRQVEGELRNRLKAIRNYLRNPVRDPHISLQEIFRDQSNATGQWVRPFLRMVKQLKRRKDVGARDPESMGR